MSVRASVVLLGVALGACGGCKKKLPVSGSPVPTPGWLRGELPPSVHEGIPVAGGTLTVRLSSEPAGLSPLHDQQRDGVMVRYVVGPIYETLFELDRESEPRYQLKPVLAESMELSPDGLRCTFTLREGVKFHDGHSLTSADVMAVMRVLTDDKLLTTNLRSFLTDLAGFHAPDERTVIFEWKRPYFLGNRLLATSLPILPAAGLEGDFDSLALNRAPVGTGPFRFVAWETGRLIRLERNEAYWGTKAHLKEVVLRFVKDQTIATQMFEQGEFDLMTRIEPAVWRAIEEPVEKNRWAIEGYHRIKFRENNYTWIGWNEERVFFQDRRVRQALAMLYPAERVFKSIDLGLEEPVLCPFYSESQYCDPDVQRWPYDPNRARALLAEAGWTDVNGDGVLEKGGVPFEFNFLAVPYSVKAGKLAPLLQEEYRRVGIVMELETAEWAVFTSRMLKHDFDAATMGWSESDTEQDLFQNFHSSQNRGSNYVSYSSPEADRLLVELRGELDPGRRIQLARAVHRRIYEDQPYTFLATRPALDAVKRSVRGIRPAISWYDLAKIWIDPGARPSAQP